MKKKILFAIGLSSLAIGTASIAGMTTTNSDPIGLLVLPVPLVIVGSVLLSFCFIKED